MNASHATAAWVGGLDGSCRIFDAQLLPALEKRFIDGLQSFKEAHADRSFASPVIEALAACYAVVAELFAHKRSSQLDLRLERSIDQLIAIDSDNVQMKKQLHRMRDCNERHAGILQGSEILARLLMEVRRIQAAAEQIEALIRDSLQKIAGWHLASTCADIAWLEENVHFSVNHPGRAATVSDEQRAGPTVYWAKAIDFNGRAILDDHHHGINPLQDYIIIAPSLAIVEQLPPAKGVMLAAGTFICEHGIYRPPYAKEFAHLESDGYTDSLV